MIKRSNEGKMMQIYTVLLFLVAFQATKYFIPAMILYGLIF